MPCAFCGAHAQLTREHVWPEWVGGILRLPATVSHEQRFVSAGSAVSERRYNATPWRVKVRAVCAGCNTGWMSRLEEDTKTVAHGMLTGEPRVLATDEQATLSMWATTKVLVSEFLVPAAERMAPAQAFADVYATRDARELPHERFVVDVAAYGGDRRPAFYDRTAFGLDTTNRATGHKRQFDACWATFTVGRLALRIFTHMVPEPVRIGIESSLASSVATLWPPSASVRWPPGPLLSEEGPDEFAKAPATRS